MSDGPANAVAIMKEWRWRGGDPDGNTWELWKDVSEAVNRLAMQGIDRPQDVLVELLRNGELVAEGDYRWRKYRLGRHYNFEEHSSIIDQRQWQTLSDLIEQERIEVALPGGFALEQVELTKLGEGSCYPYECEFEYNRFSTSICPPDMADHDRAYFEESFSASSVKVRPARVDLEFEEGGADSIVPVPSRGGRPPAKWWPDFAEELGMYIFEEGIPDGVGHEGQSAMIDAIFARLAADGKAEPSRATVQPVINAVLARTRSAGK